MKRKNVVQQWMGLGAVMLCLSGCSVFQPTAYEPREGVVYTPWEKWKAASRDGRWTVYRVKAKHSGPVPGFVRQLHPHAGKPYDLNTKSRPTSCTARSWCTTTG